MSHFCLTYHFLSGVSTTFHQLKIAKDEIISTIWYFQHGYGHPLRQIPLINSSRNRLAVTSSSIWTKCTTSTYLWISYCSLLVQIRKLLPTRTESKILSGAFLSNTRRATASDLNNVRASAPYKGTGSTRYLEINSLIWNINRYSY